MYIEKRVLNHFKENATKGLSMEAQIEAWIEKASTSVTEKSKAEWPTCALNHRRLIFSKGRKFYKVIIESLEGHHGSVYCFIDKETGQIFKPAGWAKPASGARGNIETKDPNTVTPSTGWLYANR